MVNGLSESFEPHEMPGRFYPVKDGIYARLPNYT